MSLGTMADAELVALAKAGERDAVAELYERYFDHVYDFLLRTLRSREAAEDAAQDAFLAAFRALPTLQDESRFKAWLFSIAHNTALNNLRKTKRETPLEWPQDEERGLVLDVIDEDRLGDPEEAALLSESSSFVWEAAKGLDERQYTVIDLHLRRGLESPEIGFALGVSRNNAAVMLNRAKAGLREATTALLMLQVGRRECATLDRELARAGFQQLSPEARKAVERHTRACAECTATRMRFASPEAVFTYLSVAPAAMGMKSALLFQLLNALGPAAAGSTAAGGARPESAAGGGAAGSGATTLVGIVLGLVAAGIAAIIAALLLVPFSPLSLTGDGGQGAIEAAVPDTTVTTAPTPTAPPSTAAATAAVTVTASATSVPGQPPAAQTGGGDAPVADSGPPPGTGGRSNPPANAPPPPAPPPGPSPTLAAASATTHPASPTATVASSTPAAPTAAAPTAAPTAAVSLTTVVIVSLRQADLSVVFHPPAAVVAGEPVVYSFDVRNAALMAVGGARFQTGHLGGLSGVRWECQAVGESICPAPAASGDFDGQLTLAAGGSVTVKVFANTLPALTGSVGASASVDAPAGWVDPVPANNSAGAQFGVGTVADLLLAGSMPPLTVPGESVTHTFTVSNGGPSTATGVVFEYAIRGDAAILVGGGASLQAGRTRTQLAARCSVNGLRESCTIGSLEPGGSIQVAVRVTLRSRGPFSADATVTSATQDPVSANNTIHLGGTATAPDLTVGSATFAGAFVRGVAAPINVVVRNDGKDPSSGPVTLTIAAPKGLIVESASGNGWTCSPLESNQRCSRAEALDAGAMFAAVAFVVRAAEDAPDSLAPIFTVAGGNDTNPSNNSLTLPLKVVSNADLKVAVTPEKAGVAVGDTVSYHVFVTNGGPSMSHDVVLAVDVLPGLKLAAALPAGCAPAEGGFTCAVSKMAAGDTLEFVFNAVAGQAGQSGVAAKVSAKTPDSDESNNGAKASLEIKDGQGADLAVEISQGERGDGDLSFRVTASNGGPLSANVKLEVLLTNIALTGGEGCTVVDARISCAVGKLGPTESRTVILRGKDPDGEFAIDVVVAGDAIDPNPRNNKQKLVCNHEGGCK